MVASSFDRPSLPALRISVKRGAWRIEDPHNSASTEAEFADARKAVLARDQHTCGYCRFWSPPCKEAPSWQEVHHVDDDHKNQAPTNLTTICPLCHAYHHVGLAGVRGAAQFVLLPELSPEAFNHVQRAMWLLAEASDAPSQPLGEQVGNDARDLIAEFNILMANRMLAFEASLGQQTAHPAFLGGVMRSVDDADYDLITDSFDQAGVRLLFDASCFQDQMTAYKRNPAVFANIQPSSWILMAKGALQRLEARS